MASQFGSAFLGILGNAAKNPNLQHAAIGFLRGFAAEGLKKAGANEDMRKMLHDLGDGAEAAVVAMTANTPAAAEISQAVVEKAQPVIEKAAATARNDNPGGAG